MGCGCSSDNSGDTYSAKKSYPWKQGRANECCTPKEKSYSNESESCCKKPASGYSVYAEETENGLELREMIDGTIAERNHALLEDNELQQYKKHLVDTGIGKRDAEDMMQLIIKHMHYQNEILDQIRCELKNLRKIGGF